MTDRPRPYHRAEAERLLDYADEWTAQAEESTPEADELSCLAYAAVHALLAIHDALTAADRYAANEARQRAEASLSVTPSTDATVSDSEPDPLDDASIEEVLALAAKASRRWARTLELLKQAEEEEREQQWDDAARAFADPLDENDHRDRIDGDGQRWGRMDGGCWHHEGKYPHDFGRCSWTLQQLQGAYGPLAFAPDASPAPQDAAQDAAEGEGDAVEGGGAAGASEALLCPECGHDTEAHLVIGCFHLATDACPCLRSPSDIARHLIEAAVKVDAEFSRLLAVSTDPTAALRRAAMLEAVGVTDDQAKLFAQILARGRLLPRDLQRLKAAVEQTGGGRG